MEIGNFYNLYNNETKELLVENAEYQEIIEETYQFTKPIKNKNLTFRATFVDGDIYSNNLFLRNHEESMEDVQTK